MADLEADLSNAVFIRGLHWCLMSYCRLLYLILLSQFTWLKGRRLKRRGDEGVFVGSRPTTPGRWE